MQESKREFPDSESIRKAIDGSKGLKDRDYARVFAELVKADPNHDWPLLEQVFNFHFKPGELIQPFGPMMQMEGKRSMIPEDLSDENLDALQSTLESIDDPEYRARVSDLLWLRRKNIKAARIAVESYLKSGIQLEDPKHWVPSMERYQRAIRLARQIEPKGELPKTVLAHLEARVRHYNGKDPLYFTLKALELLAEFKFGEFRSLAVIAGKVASDARANRDFSRARSHYDVQAKLLALAKEPIGAETAKEDAALCFKEEAEVKELNNEFMVANSCWENAIQAFRNRPNLRNQIPDMHKRLTLSGEKMRAEMTSIQSEGVDITEAVEANRSLIKSLPLEDAVFTLVTAVSLIDPNELRKLSIDHINEHPLQSIMEANIVDASGRKVGIRPSAFTDDPQQYERAVAGFMAQNAEIHRQLTVQMQIAPMMRQMLEDHEIDETSITNILESSALLPQDRKEMFFQAFAAGFRWEFPLSLHILIPQIENSLRHILVQNGITPTSLNADGIEEVWGFESILRHPKLISILDESFVYELQSILVERLGPNIRNLLAHGLLSSNELKGPIPLYLWWLFLRLAAFPTAGMKAFLERKKMENSEPPATS